MIKPIIPENEDARLAALHSYGILNSEKEEAYDSITALAAKINNVPISLISLVDQHEVWFKSTTGMDICSADRNLSFCSYGVGEAGNTIVINDSRKDVRFDGHPFVNGDPPIIFYAGVCLVDRNGHKLGTLCVIDHKPREISKNQIESLGTLAVQVVKLIELHRANHVLAESKKNLELQNESLRNFAGVLSHDMKMPLANIIMTTDLLKAKYAGDLDAKAAEYLNYLKSSSFNLSDYIDNILKFYESDFLNEVSMETIYLTDVIENIVDMMVSSENCEIQLPENNVAMTVNKSGLEQILVNLLGNSIKYCDKEIIKISMKASEDSSNYYFSIKDNGMGIHKSKLRLIFKPFKTLGTIDRNGNKGNGLGLATVSKLVSKMGGTIKVSSDLGQYTRFDLCLAKRNTHIQ